MSRILSPSVGFALNFTMVLLVLYYNGIWIYSAIDPILSNTFQVLGVKLGDMLFIELSHAIKSPSYVVGIGIVLLIFFGILVIILKPSQFGKMLLALFVIGAITIVPSYLIVGMASHTDIVLTINNFAYKAGYQGHNFYTYVLETADLSGMVGPYPTISMPAMLGSFILPYWVFQWAVFLSSYVSSEVKAVKRSQFLGMFGCMLLLLVWGLGSIALLWKAQDLNLFTQLAGCIMICQTRILFIQHFQA